jgi:two-component system phosphate regulon sensor histidine kinase PhoR
MQSILAPPHDAFLSPAMTSTMSTITLAHEWSTQQILLWLMLAVAIVTLLWTLFSLNRSVRRLRRAAMRFAAGDLSHPLPIRGPGPIAHLSETMNRMARQLDDRLQTVLAQRNELEAVLSSMVEGVMVIDLDERVMRLNRAAAEMLDIKPGRAIGRSIQEVVRNVALQQFVAETLTSDAPTQRDLVLRISSLTPNGDEEAGERFLQAQGATMRDAAGQRIGALLVLHDVTRLRRLEMIRREFVGNVSHEIRTPITAIKGAVETLLDDPTENVEDHQRFLAIIRRQADRLHAIIEDLLSLARIEQDSERARIAVARERLCDVVEGAVEVCLAAAQAKGVQLDLSCDKALEAMISAPLLEQAVVNLLDNAIKYSPPNSVVTIEARQEGDELVLSVIDEGCGIEPEHLPRVFERFYRPDRARSRALGGTGLGLSIVKHIAQAHRGRVSVKSQPGMGSTFRIVLPINPFSAEAATT